MTDYKLLAKEIVENVGGTGNINSVTNCMTRLRFGLKDKSKVKEDHLKATPGVQGVAIKGGQYQVIIGTDVAHVCEEIKQLGSFSDTIAENVDEKGGVVNKVLGAITAIFQPIIPAICGAGMIKAVLALLVFLKVLNVEMQTYQLLALLADSAFYFLPVMLAVTSALRFKANPYYAAVLGAMLIHPSFIAMVGAGEPIQFAGIPVKAVSYGAAVVPPILLVWVMSYVERFAKKVSPNAVKVFLVPLIVFLVTAPLGWTLIGPAGSTVGDVLLVVFEFLNNEARWVLPVLMGAFTPFFVMTGMHYSFMPVQLPQYATLGYGTLLGPGMLASNISQAGASLAVGLRTKDKTMKQTAFSASTTALFGISEPALYGVTMKLRSPLWAVVVSGGVAGLWAGLTNMRTYASATAGVLALPVYITDDMSNVMNAAICIVIAFVLSFLLTFFFAKVELADTKAPETVGAESIAVEQSGVAVSAAQSASVQIKSPVSGKIIPNIDIPDSVFSTEVMGRTIAVEPSEGTIYAPFDAEVVSLFPTKHGIGLRGKNDVEVLIHVGIDTVELEGAGYESSLKMGDKVKAGDPLVHVDIDYLKEKGYSTITPIIVTNTDSYSDVIALRNKENVSHEDTILAVFN